MDARGAKGSWEALVYYVNEEKTAAIQTMADNAQWFEDHMPWDPAYRKSGVRGITANAIDVVVEVGDSGPVTPIGINLPRTIRMFEKSMVVNQFRFRMYTDAYERSRPEAIPKRVYVG